MLPLVPFARARTALSFTPSVSSEPTASPAARPHRAGAEDAYDRAKSGTASLWASGHELGRAKAQVEVTAAEMRKGVGEVVEAAAEKGLDAAEKLEETAEELKRDA